MDTEKLVRAFKALGNENRVKILEAIKNSALQCACQPEQDDGAEPGKSTLCCVDQIAALERVAQRGTPSTSQESAVGLLYGESSGA
jgi:DNA-binding transcriptional ArsR family regulator